MRKHPKFLQSYEHKSSDCWDHLGALRRLILIATYTVCDRKVSLQLGLE